MADSQTGALSPDERECGTVPMPNTKATRTWRAQIVKSGLLVGGKELIPNAELPALIELAKEAFFASLVSSEENPNV